MRAARTARGDEAGGGERFIADTFMLSVFHFFYVGAVRARQAAAQSRAATWCLGRASCMDVFLGVQCLQITARVARLVSLAVSVGVTQDMTEKKRGQPMLGMIYLYQ